MDGRELVSAGSTTDIYGPASTLPLSFSGAQLLSNDSAGAAIAMVDAASKSGGSIIGVGGGTYIYTPAPAFTVSVSVTGRQVQSGTYFATVVSIASG